MRSGMIMLLMTVEGAPGQKLIDLSDEMLESFFKYSGISQYRKLCFAVHELVINAVEATLEQHSQGSPCLDGTTNEEAKMSIRMELNGEDIVITISSDGPALMMAHKQLNLDDLLQEDRRRGLLIAKRLSDQLIFEQDDQGRITIQLRKKGGIEHGQSQCWTTI